MGRESGLSEGRVPAPPMTPAPAGPAYRRFNFAANRYVIG